MAYRQQQQRAVALPEPGRVGTLLVRGATEFARRHKSIAGTYVIGLILVVIFGSRGSGTALTPQQHADYNRIMNSIDLETEYQATEDYWRAQNLYYQTKGWFWSCDPVCQHNKARMQEAEHVLNAIRRETASRTSDAKSVAGLFSKIGISEVQDSFWNQFYRGKQFAKRQSMWDAMFIGMRSMTRGRDESWIEFGLKVLMQVLLNFSLGLVMALIFFVFGLWSIVRSYQPNPFIAVLFFVGASAAAFSFVVTYLMAIYGAAAGGVYGILKVGESATRARIAEEERRRVQWDGGRQQRRPHYD